jgi:hypothetical protein
MPCSTRASPGVSALRSSACSDAFEPHHLVHSASHLATGAEPAFTHSPRAQWKRLGPCALPSPISSRSNQSLSSQGRSTPGSGQAVGRQSNVQVRQRADECAAPTTERRLRALAVVGPNVGRAPDDGPARSARHDVGKRQRRDSRPWHGANAQVKRQAEARELPVYFLVSSWSAALVRTSVVPAGMSRTNASCKSRLTRHLESTLIADDRQ